jgi:formyl-CoA transferase
MLNANKRSITLNSKSEDGKTIFTKLIEHCDVLVENFGPGVLDRQGFPWEKIKQINPRMIYASIKGFGPGAYEDFKAYETVAQAMGGSMSTTGWEEGPPTSTGSQIGDSGSGIHMVAGILAALYGGQPGAALRCKPGGPNDYVYVVIQPQVWAPLATLIGREELVEHPEYATPEARVSHLGDVFAQVEKWTQNFTKFEVLDKLNSIDVPCGPILSTKDLINDPSLNARGMIAEVEHPKRGKYKTVGCPLVLSDTPVEIERSPLLGEHTEEILKEIGWDRSDVTELRAAGAV